MSLVLVQDSETPQAPYSKDVVATWVYLGGAGAANTWTRTDIVGAAGRFPLGVGFIWVPAQGGAFDGLSEAESMLNALAAGNFKAPALVALDVEQNTKDAFSGWLTQADAFVAKLKAEGYTAVVYGYDWEASWPVPSPSTPPTTLPAGIVGWQYANRNTVDLSVFEPNLPWWRGNIAPPKPATPTTNTEPSSMIFVAEASNTYKHLTTTVEAGGIWLVNLNTGTKSSVYGEADVKTLLGALKQDAPTKLSGETLSTFKG